MVEVVMGETMAVDTALVVTLEMPLGKNHKINVTSSFLFKL
jgi:hypothetical protein